MSEHWRQEGNVIYKAALTEPSPEARDAKLQQAVAAYRMAFNTAQTPKDKCSAAKNLAMAYKRLTDIATAWQHEAKTKYYECEAVYYFSNAKLEGKSQSSEWQASLIQTYQEYLDSVLTRSAGEDKFLARLIKKMSEEDEFRADCHLQLARFYFHKAVRAIEKEDVKGAMSALKDCNTPLEQSETLGKDRAAFLSEVESLRRDISLHSCLASSLQARQTGDSLLRTLVTDSEDLNLDLTWDIVDWYRQAVTRSREVEMEQEAIALCRLGVLYHRVLKLKSRAKECLRACLQLVDSLHPKTFNMKDWYKECTAIMQEYQTEETKQDDKIKEERRQKALESLKEEISELKELDSLSDKEYLEAIFAKFPPHNGKHTFEI